MNDGIFAINLFLFRAKQARELARYPRCPFVSVRFVSPNKLALALQRHKNAWPGLVLFFVSTAWRKDGPRPRRKDYHINHYLSIASFKEKGSLARAHTHSSSPTKSKSTTTLSPFSVFTSLILPQSQVSSHFIFFFLLPPAFGLPSPFPLLILTPFSRRSSSSSSLF